MLRWIALFVGLLRWSCVSASAGDRSPYYLRCVLRCSQSGCARIWLSEETKLTTGLGTALDSCRYPQACPHFTSAPIPVDLALTRWSCEDDCRYHCMMATEEFRRKTSQSAVKYHGKWAFKRAYGAQEIFSSILSLCNFFAHIQNAIVLWSEIKTTRQRTKVTYPYSGLWCLYVGAHLNAWIWSTVFHARDMASTEKFDYFSAGLTVFVGLYVSMARCAELRFRGRAVALLSLLGVYSRLVYYLYFVKFDYGYNMAMCIVIGIAQGAIWVGWAWKTRHPSRMTVWLFFLGLYTSMLAEVFDFPPIAQYIDAHATWHAATIPLTYVWYKFIIADVRWCCEAAPMEKSV